MYQGWNSLPHHPVDFDHYDLAEWATGFDIDTMGDKQRCRKGTEVFGAEIKTHQTPMRL